MSLTKAYPYSQASTWRKPQCCCQSRKTPPPRQTRAMTAAAAGSSTQPTPSASPRLPLGKKLPWPGVQACLQWRPAWWNESGLSTSGRWGNSCSSWTHSLEQPRFSCCQIKNLFIPPRHFLSNWVNTMFRKQPIFWFNHVFSKSPIKKIKRLLVVVFLKGFSTGKWSEKEGILLVSKWHQQLVGKVVKLFFQ